MLVQQLAYNAKGIKMTISEPTDVVEDYTYMWSWCFSPSHMRVRYGKQQVPAVRFQELVVADKLLKPT